MHCHDDDGVDDVEVSFSAFLFYKCEKYNFHSQTLVLGVGEDIRRAVERHGVKYQGKRFTIVYYSS